MILSQVPTTEEARYCLVVELDGTPPRYYFCITLEEVKPLASAMRLLPMLDTMTLLEWVPGSYEPRLAGRRSWRKAGWRHAAQYLAELSIDMGGYLNELAGQGDA